MFDSEAINIIISLVFIYLLYSLLGTILQEIIATNIQLRGRILRQGISRMLDDGAAKKKWLRLPALITSKGTAVTAAKQPGEEAILSGESVQDQSQLKLVSQAFYKHPLV